MGLVLIISSYMCMILEVDKLYVSKTKKVGVSN